MRRAAASPRRTQGVLGGRSDQVVRRVLDAALAELARSGYSSFRMDAIASAAAVNKTTIYRRWPTRAALVTSVVERLRLSLRTSSLPDTGALERDLIAAFRRRTAIACTVEGRAWARLLQERHTADVESIIGVAVDDRRDEWRAMVDRALQRGELPPGTDAQLLLDVVRAIVDARDPSHQWGARWLPLAVKTVLAGARAGTLTRRRGARAQSRRARGGQPGTRRTS